MEIRIVESGELLQITLVDPKTGCDWFRDCGVMDCDDIRYNVETEEYEATQEAFEWWSDYALQKQSADFAVKEVADSLGNDDRDTFLQEVLRFLASAMICMIAHLLN